MPLSCSICKPVGVKSSQELIVEHLWNCPQLVRPANRKAQPDYTPYFGFYTHQCRIALQASPRLGTRSHQDVLDLAHKITADEPREKLEDALSSMEEKSEGIQEEERLEKAAASIDLVVRLMLMIEVGELKNTFSGRQPLVWTKGTVDDFVHELFEPQTSQNLERGKFGRLFTAQNLALIAGFRVELTTNLADHLLFRDSDKTVMIFHHATFLSHQLGYV